MAEKIISDSDIFTEDEINSAMFKVYKKFGLDFEGCILIELEYDEKYSKERAKEWAENYGYDKQQFTDALSALEEEDRKLSLLVNTADAQRLRVARTVAQLLTDCGLTVTLVQKAGKDFTEALEEENYDLYLAQTKLSANMDLSAFFREDGSLSYGGLEDPGIYALCLEALANSGNYYDLHEAVMEEGWLCPILFQSYAVYGARGAVSSLTPARDHLFFYSTGRTMADVFFKE